MRTLKSLFKIYFLTLILTSCFNKKKVEPIPIATCGNTCGNEQTNPRPAIFLAKCVSCHMIDKNSTGPKLLGVLNKIPNEKWYEDFVKNEDSLIKQKEPYTLLVNKTYLPIKFNHNFKEITKEQIEELKNLSK